MNITDADSARAWLQSWGGMPRRGILLAAIDGLLAARTIANAARYSDETRRGYDEAILVLTVAEAA